MIYVASPYSHPEPLVVTQRFGEVERYTATLLKHGFVAFSPIVHCHAIAEKYGLPADADFWHNFNMSILRHCEKLHLLMLEGWQLSKGCTAEVNFAKTACIPIERVNP